MYKAVSHAESHYQGCHRSVVAVLQDLHCICLPKSPCVSPEGSVQASEISSPTNNFRTQGVIVGLCWRDVFYGRALLTIAVLAPLVCTGTDWTVYLQHAGPLRIGMSLATVRRVLGDQTARLTGNEPEIPLNSCAYLQSTRVPRGLGFMFEGGRVV